MAEILRRVKNVIKIIVLGLILCLIQYDILAQKAKIHHNFLYLMDSDDTTPIYFQIIKDRDWLLILSDSLKVNNLLRGGCRIKDLWDVFEKYDFDSILEQKEYAIDIEKWQKKKLPGLKVKNKIPDKGNYAKYSIPYFSDQWGIIRKQYFEKNELMEDSIIIYSQDNKEKWNQVCQLFLSLSFPHYPY